MATRKTAKKAATEHTAKKRATRTATPAKAAPASDAARPTRSPAPAPSSGPSEPAGLRVRMYRVGFGDFFLLSIPTPTGQEHILIDCGVFKGTSGTGDLHTIEGAVDNLAQATGGKLALVIMTHRHADHIIGFSRCKAQFQKMKVGAVWMPAWESEYDAKAQKFQAQLTSAALKLDAHLAALAAAGTSDPSQAAARDMLYNATGAGSLSAAGGGTNAASLDLLKRGFGVTPDYIRKVEATNDLARPQKRKSGH